MIVLNYTNSKHTYGVLGAFSSHGFDIVNLDFKNSPPLLDFAKIKPSVIVCTEQQYNLEIRLLQDKCKIFIIDNFAIDYVADTSWNNLIPSDFMRFPLLYISDSDNHAILINSYLLNLAIKHSVRYCIVGSGWKSGYNLGNFNYREINSLCSVAENIFLGVNYHYLAESISYIGKNPYLIHKETTVKDLQMHISGSKIVPYAPTNITYAQLVEKYL